MGRQVRLTFRGPGERDNWSRYAAAFIEKMAYSETPDAIARAAAFADIMLCEERKRICADDRKTEVDNG